jgi:hypothetical protein
LTHEVLNYPKATKMKPMLLNKKALAATLGCSPQTVLRLVKAGKLPQPVFGQFYYLPNVIRALSGEETVDIEGELARLEANVSHSPRIVRTDPAP